MKKIFSLILALCMIFSLVACSDETAIETEPIETEAIVYLVTEPMEASTETEILTAEPSIVETEPFVTEEVVEYFYITASGSKYHKITCRYVDANDRAVTREEAQSMGKSPCKVCNP